MSTLHCLDPNANYFKWSDMLINCVLIQGLHPSKAAFEGRLHHGFTTRLSHFEGSFKSGLGTQLCFPGPQKLQQVDPSKIHCAPVMKRIWQQTMTMSLNYITKCTSINSHSKEAAQSKYRSTYNDNIGHYAVHKECFWKEPSCFYDCVFTCWWVCTVESPLIYQLQLVLVCMIVPSVSTHPDYVWCWRQTLARCLRFNNRRALNIRDQLSLESLRKCWFELKMLVWCQCVPVWLHYDSHETTG